MTVPDRDTAEAFASSWNNLPRGSVYTRAQFEDWMAPLRREDFDGKAVLELGCGNGSLLVHCKAWRPARVVGVDLGASVLAARKNVELAEMSNAEIVQGDLGDFRSGGFDITYCIGVLHHMTDPERGFRSVIRNTTPGGRFHCWVYAREGNAIVINVVDPIRKIASRLPWWLNKYVIATPLCVPYFAYAKALKYAHTRWPALSARLRNLLPLRDYSLWIAEREFAFFRHVAFDQLVTPQTTYIERTQIENWIGSCELVEPGSTYIVMRNGNSWKFGGRRRVSEAAS